MKGKGGQRDDAEKEAEVMRSSGPSRREAAQAEVRPRRVRSRRPEQQQQQQQRPREEAKQVRSARGAEKENPQKLEGEAKEAQAGNRKALPEGGPASTSKEPQERPNEGPCV